MGELDSEVPQSILERVSRNHNRTIVWRAVSSVRLA